MSEINPLGAANYYAGIQNASGQTAREQKTDKVKGKKIRFSTFLKQKDTLEEETRAAGFPPEIARMSVEDAAIFLKDAVDIAGDELIERQNPQTVEKFKTAVQQFIKFVVQNNYQVSKKSAKTVSGVNYFSSYQLPAKRVPRNYQIQVINEKIDSFTRGMLQNQMSNLQILAQVGEIKGLIVDFLSS